MVPLQRYGQKVEETYGIVEEVFGKVAETWRRFYISPSRFSLEKVKRIYRNPKNGWISSFIFSRFENSCHSLHGCYNCLIINFPACNDKQKRHVTNVTFRSSDISDMIKIATLHGRTLVFNGLWCLCNECNGFMKANLKSFIRKLCYKVLRYLR